GEAAHCRFDRGPRLAVQLGDVLYRRPEGPESQGDLEFPLRELLRKRPQRVDGRRRLLPRHLVVYAADPGVVLAAYGVVSTLAQAVGDHRLARIVQEVSQPEHIVPSGLAEQAGGERYRVAAALAPQAPRGGVGGEQPGLPVSAIIARDLRTRIRAEEVNQADRLQQFPRRLEKLAGFIGEGSGPFLLVGQN